MNPKEIQQRLNDYRQARDTPLRAIPVTGRMNQTTRDALRCFQHEHNMAVEEYDVPETGEMDEKTEVALLNWKLFLEEAS